MATEKRLIDANVTKSKLQEHRDFFVNRWGGFNKMPFAAKSRVDEIDNCIAEIVNAPTVDAVEVVRCKNCDHWKDSVSGCTDHVKFCEIGFYMVGENGYCVYVERKTDG